MAFPPGALVEYNFEIKQFAGMGFPVGASAKWKKSKFNKWWYANSYKRQLHGIVKYVGANRSHKSEHRTHDWNVPRKKHNCRTICPMPIRTGCMLWAATASWFILCRSGSYVVRSRHSRTQPSGSSCLHHRLSLHTGQSTHKLGHVSFLWELAKSAGPCLLSRLWEFSWWAK